MFPYYGLKIAHKTSDDLVKCRGSLQCFELVILRDGIILAKITAKPPFENANFDLTMN